MPAHDQIDEAEIIVRLYAAMTSGDIAAARACCNDQARFWHCFDGVSQSLDEASRSWEALTKVFCAMRVQDVRRIKLSDGRWLVQQLFVARRAEGKEIGWAICLLVTLRDALIDRIEEYIDRAATFPIDSPNTRTPGL
jgi:ketosteroid isomerase-like protein